MAMFAAAAADLGSDAPCSQHPLELAQGIEQDACAALLRRGPWLGRGDRRGCVGSEARQ